MQVVLLTIVIAFLGLLGWIAKKCIFRLWGNFQIIRFFADDIYGTIPMSKRHFIFVVLCWCVTLVCLVFPPVTSLCLIIIAVSMRRVIKRSSPEVAYRLAWYAFLMALVIVFTLVGFIAMIFAMASRREAIARGNFEQLRRLDNFHAVTAINRIN